MATPGQARERRKIEVEDTAKPPRAGEISALVLVIGENCAAGIYRWTGTSADLESHARRRGQTSWTLAPARPGRTTQWQELADDIAQCLDEATRNPAARWNTEQWREKLTASIEPVLIAHAQRCAGATATHWQRHERGATTTIEAPANDGGEKPSPDKEQGLWIVVEATSTHGGAIRTRIENRPPHRSREAQLWWTARIPDTDPDQASANATALEKILRDALAEHGQRDSQAQNPGIDELERTILGALNAGGADIVDAATWISAKAQPKTRRPAQHTEQGQGHKPNTISKGMTIVQIAIIAVAVGTFTGWLADRMHTNRGAAPQARTNPDLAASQWEIHSTSEHWQCEAHRASVARALEKLFSTDAGRAMHADVPAPRTGASAPRNDRAPEPWHTVRAPKAGVTGWVNPDSGAVLLAIEPVVSARIDPGKLAQCNDNGDQ